MSKGHFNITTTFYAKWILPFVLMIIGVLLLLIFVPGGNFQSYYDKYENKTTIYYIYKENNNPKYVDIETKLVYTKEKVGTTGVKYTPTGETYEKRIPYYHKLRTNLSTMGIASGISLCIIGIFMIIINTFNKIAKYDPYKGRTKKKETNNED